MFLGARLGSGWEAVPQSRVTQGVPFSGLKGVARFHQRRTGAHFRPRPDRLHGARLPAQDLEPRRRLGGSGVRANRCPPATRRERLVLTAGIVSVLDVFDAMDYSRDARTQFMNWCFAHLRRLGLCRRRARLSRTASRSNTSRRAWSLRAGRFAMPVESNGLRSGRRIRQLMATWPSSSCLSRALRAAACCASWRSAIGR